MVTEPIPPRPRRQFHHWTPEEDAFLCQWRGKATTRQLAAHIGVSPGAISGRIHWLRKQGAMAAETNGPIELPYSRLYWLPEEVELLDEWLGEGRTLEEIASRLKRSVNAVAIKARRGLQWQARESREWHTQQDVARMLGVSKQWVNNRIKAGKLRAKPYLNQPQQDGGALWQIKRTDLKRFIRRHAWELQGKDVDLAMVVEIVAGLRYDSRSLGRSR